MTHEQEEEERTSSAVIPKVALRWILLHATNSNVELARLSNVNRSWRDVVTAVILEQATLKAESSSAPLLLLPSMAAQLVRRENSYSDTATTEISTTAAETTTSTTTRGETFCAAWFAPEGIQLLDLDEEQQGSSDDDDSSSSSDDYNDNQRNNPRQGMHRHCRHSSANSGGGTTNPKKSKHARSKSPMMMTIQRRAPRLEQIPQHQTWGRGHGLAAKPSFEDQGILVSHEWRGYRHAMEILHPFGYAELFVQHVLQRAQVHERSGELIDEQKNNLMVDVSDSINRVRQDEAEPLNTTTTETTIAVRGATIARPEGYCLCWDARMAREKQQLAQQNGNNSNDTMVQTIKWQERQRKLKQWKEWRRQLQLTVLPQVLVRRPPHSNAVIQFLNSDEKHAVRFLTPQFQCGPIGEPVTIIIVGIATEDGCFCSGRSHKFELGHLYPNSSLAELAEMSPICIATDSWWEQCQQQQSAIATTTGASGGAAATATVISPTASSDRRSPLEQHLASDSDDDSDNDDDDNDDDGDDDDDDEFSSDSSSELAGNHRVPPHRKRGWLHNCTCIFHDNSNPCGFGTTITSSSTKPSNQHNNRNGNKTTMQPQQNVEREDSQTLREEDEDDDEDDEDDENNDKESHDAERIIRGSRIPGMWHCYTAIFDGKQSVIRVDGVPEVLKTTTSKKSSSSTPKRSRRPMLDGLTIGSDHCFDMTLCFGQGSGGEGEGAIAEIAVFGGRLDTVDLECLERQLMRKHGIPIPNLSREALVQEDDWTRKAHALYCQLPPEAAPAQLRQTDAGKPLAFNQGNSIPLRVMAKHRSVAWHQFNAVTGEELRIKRIGSRSAGSSSDW